LGGKKKTKKGSAGKGNFKKIGSKEKRWLKDHGKKQKDVGGEEGS